MTSASRKRRSPAPVLAALLVSIVGLLWLLRGGDTGEVRLPGQVENGSAPSDSARVPAPAGDAEPRAPHLEALPAAAQEPSAGNEPCRVVDGSFGTPLFARIEPDVGPIVFSDEDTGVFALDGASADWSLLRATSDGYEELHFPRADADPKASLLLRMLASRAGTLIVQFENGTPAMGVAVAWRPAVEIPFARDPEGWISTRAQSRGEPVLTRTDIAGLTNLPLAAPAIAEVRDPRGSITKTVRVLPGQTIRITLPDATTRVRFVESRTNEPLAGLELDAWSPRDGNAMSEPLRTDLRGEIALAPTSFPVLVRRSGKADLESELVPLTEGVARFVDRDIRASVIRIDAPQVDLQLVAVKLNPWRVRLLDEASGKPVDADVRVQAVAVPSVPRPNAHPGQTTASSPRRPTDLGPVVTARDGVLVLSMRSLYRTDYGALLDGRVKDTALALSALGYAPLRIRADTERQTDAEGVPTFRLEPATPRTLHLVHPSGQPYVGRMVVYSQGRDFLCFGSEGERDGIYGPFDWCGGSLQVGPISEALPWLVASNGLAKQEVVTLVVSECRGSIVVEDVPEGTSRLSLLARLDAVDFTADGEEPGKLSFSSLPCGSYLVGPRAWVRGLWRPRPLEDDDDSEPLPPTPRELFTLVQSGETTVVRWREAWAAGRRIEGRVRILGSAGLEPFLVPLYDPPPAKEDPPKLAAVALSRRSPRLALDGEGRYSIDATDPLPTWIAVCVADETSWAGLNGMHVIEVLTPGESADIPTGSIELTWRAGDGGGRQTVAYEVPSGALRHPVSTQLRWSDRLWSGDSLRLEGVPLHVRALWIGNYCVLPVVVTEGAVERVEVEWSKLRRGRARR